MKQKAVLLISGEVQGVGYRYFVVSTAKQLGLTGWVRNNADGTVESEAEGEKQAIDEFIKILKTKHTWARVEAVEVTWKKSDGKYSDFFIE